MTIIWTQAMSDAIDGLVADETTNEDVYNRALEYQRLCRPGTVLQPFQVEYTICLYQRLDWHDPRPSHAEFKKAWEEASGPTR